MAAGKEVNQGEIAMSIQGFGKMNLFTKNIMSLIINLTFDKNDLQLLKLAFKQIDKDNSGTISFEEF